MILQALCEYYDRLRADPASGVAEPGFAPQNVHFAIEISSEGELLRLIDLRDREGKRLVPRRMLLPSLGIKRASGILANFLWDNASYTLGLDAKGKPERTRQCFEAFAKQTAELCAGLDDPGVAALRAFLASWSPEQAAERFKAEEIEGANFVFRLTGENAFLHERPALRKAWNDRVSSAGIAGTMCLVTGRTAPPARLHPAIKGVRGAQSSGAALVSFNLDAFTSYGKEQNYNAPMSEDAAFAYTTALNHLLRYENNHKLQLGDASTVFWTERESPVEHFLAAFMGNAGPQDESAEEGGDVQAVHDFLDAVRQGRMPDIMDEPDMRFYILGLAPNAARISVRFWHVDSVAGFLDKLGAHFRALEIARHDNDRDFPPVWMLLRTIAAQGKEENIPAPLAAGLMRAVLTGADYPRALLGVLLMRIRADKIINYLRAALIKACLVRNHHLEVTVALDRERKDEAYRIGRLFAMLELAQIKAIGPGAGIRDRFYGAASTTPLTVFPRLLQLYGHHLQKLRKGEFGGYAVSIDRELVDILSEINCFPCHFGMEQQGLFALGYYHQRKDFFTKRETAATEPIETTEPAVSGDSEE
ncbi:MAG: type I-C CRISPR-associated protein Cas8c/Csd1 [Desulfovibrio sp.]